MIFVSETPARHLHGPNPGGAHSWVPQGKQGWQHYSAPLEGGCKEITGNGVESALAGITAAWGSAPLFLVPWWLSAQGGSFAPSPCASQGVPQPFNVQITPIYL